jgi:hypothetical protein
MSITLKNVRRQVAGFSLAMMIASMFAIGVAQAATFADVQPTDWSYPFVEDLAVQGILDTSKRTYEPGRDVNRAEMAKLAVEAWDLTLETPTEAPFKDVALGQWYTPYIYTAKKNNLIGGYKDNEGTLTGYFGPGDSLTREQAMKIITLAASLTTNTKGGPHFSDVPLSRWSYEYVETGYNWSVVDGFPNTDLFKPDTNVLRDQIAKMVSNGLAPEVRPGAGFGVDDAYATSLTEVTVCFSGEVGDGADVAANYEIKDADGDALAVTGADVSTDPMCVDLTTASQDEGKNYDLVVSNVMSTADEELDIADISFTGFSAMGTGGDLTCTAGEQPAGVSVPKGATGVPFTVVNCQATSDTVYVTGMTFHRFGAGNQGDFDNVYLYRDDTRLTTGRTVNSETQNVEFSGLNLEVGSSGVTFVVVGDIALGAAPASQHGFELLNTDAITSNAESVDGDFPVEGNLMTISGASAGTITISKNGSLDDLTIGEAGRIAQFQLEAGGTEAMTLYRVALYVRGSCASSNVTDLKLYDYSGELLSETDSVGAKDLATFVLDEPFTIGQGDSKIFYVEAANNCRNAETIKVYLEETTDLLVKGVTFGTGVQVNDAAYNGTAGNFSEVLVKGSDFNAAFNGPAASDIAVGQSQASCLDLTLSNKSGQSLDIKDWEVTVAVTNGDLLGDANDLLDDATPTITANYTLFKLAKRNDDGTWGSSLLGPAELSTSVGANDLTQPVKLAGSNTIAPDAVIKASVIFNVANNAALDGDKIRCTLTNLSAVGRDFIRDQNNDALDADSVTPSSDIVGNVQNISGAGLTFSVASSPTSRTYVRGQDNASVFGLSVRSGPSLDNTLKSLTLQGYVDGDDVIAPDPIDAFDASGTDAADANDATATVLKDVLDNVALYDGETMVSSIVNIGSTNGKVVFNNLNIKVGKNETKVLTVKGHINNSAPYGTMNDRLKFGLAAKTDVSAIDQNGKTIPNGSIINNAENTGALDSGVFMTITAGGTGVVTNSATTQQKAELLSGATTKSVGMWKFDSTDEDLTLKDLTFVAYDTNSATVVKFYVDNVQVGATNGYSIESDGTVLVKNLNLLIPDSTPKTLEAKVTTNAVDAGKATSGDAVGMSLLSIDNVISGAGTNIANSYMGTATDLLQPLVVAMATSGATVNDLCTAAAPALVPGDVVKVDDEVMVVDTAPGAGVAPCTQVTKVARLHPVSHSVGTATIELTQFAPVDTRNVFTTTAVGLGALLNGDIFYEPFVATGNYTGFCVVTDAVAGTAVNIYTGAGCVVAPVTRFIQHGSVSVVRKAAPQFENLAMTAPFTLGSSDLTMMKIKIKATGVGDVSFKNADGNMLVIATDGSYLPLSCRLVDSGGNVLDDGTWWGAPAPLGPPYGAAVGVMFNFSQDNLIVAANGEQTVEVRCDTSTAAAPPTSQTTLRLMDAWYNDGFAPNITTDLKLFKATFPLVGSTYSIS